MIYEPREDSFLLEKYAKQLTHGKVLDMGTGSGIQALAAKEKTKDIVAADINQEAVAHVKRAGINALQSDLFQNIKGTFDVILFNPPYLPEVKEEDEESKQITTGGKQGYELLERFLKEAKQHLNPKGMILLVYSSLTGNIISLAKKQGYQLTMLKQKKIAFETLTAAKLSLSSSS